jgi:hypothetical protein
MKGKIYIIILINRYAILAERLRTPEERLQV